jgi:hypothetical protein
VDFLNPTPERVGIISPAASSANLASPGRHGELIEKSLVEQQAAYLLVALRQRILSVPHTYARRILGLADAAQASKVLKEMALSLLNEIKDLPAKVTDPNWLDTLEGNDSPSETVEAGKASGSKGRSG